MSEKTLECLTVEIRHHARLDTPEGEHANTLTQPCTEINECVNHKYPGDSSHNARYITTCENIDELLQVERRDDTGDLYSSSRQQTTPKKFWVLRSGRAIC